MNMLTTSMKFAYEEGDIYWGYEDEDVNDRATEAIHSVLVFACGVIAAGEDNVWFQNTCPQKNGAITALARCLHISSGGVGIQTSMASLWKFHDPNHWS
ncbi:hypothetical protein RHMOL_Rhmol07G0005100 [Rhododendron molle]|uniref:Uncharacterized protein n=1 Tax=Rhododendron molle TaxID=49168 RepID=A0ACC0MVM8_RHOML|nr:hypothetical protein RHMOL_Rhmol07G0005100 [Rhododendron molle]